MNILPIWGTMRMLQHSNSPVFWTSFLEQLYLKGIRHIHSSNEYESFPLLTKCLQRLNEKGIIFGHIVKLAEPSFHEGNFSEDRFVSKIDLYNQILPGQIETIQWMWRSERSDNFRIDSFLNQKESVEIAFKKYNVCCFPYSTGFAEEAIRLKNLNGLVVYWNKNEINYLKSVTRASKNNKVNYILRPFGGGRIGGLSSSEMLHYCKEVPGLKGIIFTATKDEHLNEAISFFEKNLKSIV
jgi:hypothetical protein